MDLEVYCDESRQEYFSTKRPIAQERYVVLGSLWLESVHRTDIKTKIKALREVHNIHGEFKWTRVSPSRQLFYTELVNLFFDEPIRFRCIVLPASQLDAIQFHRADNELMFYKFYYLMLQSWILDFNTYRIFIDMKTNRVRQRLLHLQEFLSRSNYFADVAIVQALPSEEVDLLQLVDILIGAVGYHFNGGGASPAKQAVTRAIEQRLGHPIQPTRKTEEKLNVFRWRPGGGW
ncbi:MAG: DUF3800 domain-containing protein [Anaerolineae bacterium]|nr:DUF3800 domain-containing protein [Anaerolineae bacterium]